MSEEQASDPAVDEISAIIGESLGFRWMRYQDHVRTAGGHVAATLNKESHGILMVFVSGSTIVPGQVEKWPPMTLTMSRPCGDRRFTIKLNEPTMSKQADAWLPNASLPTKWRLPAGTFPR